MAPIRCQRSEEALLALRGRIDEILHFAQGGGQTEATARAAAAARSARPRRSAGRRPRSRSRAGRPGCGPTCTRQTWVETKVAAPERDGNLAKKNPRRIGRLLIATQPRTGRRARRCGSRRARPRSLGPRARRTRPRARPRTPRCRCASRRAQALGGKRLANPAQANFLHLDPGGACGLAGTAEQHAAPAMFIEQREVASGAAAQQGNQLSHDGLHSW